MKPIVISETRKPLLRSVSKAVKPSRSSWTVKVDGTTFLNCVDFQTVLDVCQFSLRHRKSVRVVDNLTRKCVAHFIYGHRQ